MNPLKTPTDFAELSREDTVSLSITHDAAPDTVEFILETAPSVTWWKAIEIHPANGPATNVETQDDRHGPVTLTYRAADLVGATLTLAKAKIFGIHTGMYDMQNLTAFRGQRLHFLWQRDDDRDGPVAGFFRDLGAGLGRAAEAVAGAVITVFNFIGGVIGTIIEFIGNFIGGIFYAIGDWLGGIPGIGPALRTFFHWIGSVITAVFDLWSAAIRLVFEVVGAVIGGIILIVVGGIGGLLAWDARYLGKGLADIGYTIAGNVIGFGAKILGFLQAFFFMQLGDRPLMEAERQVLIRVYRGSLDLVNIRIVDGFAGLYSTNDRAFTVGNRIYMKDVRTTDRPDILVHECCHVWQFQHFGSRYIMEALYAQAAITDAYNWELELTRGKSRWQDFNREAQAQFIQDIYLYGRQTSISSGTIGGQGSFFAHNPIGANVTFTGRQGTVATDLARDTVFRVRNGVW